MVLTVSVLITFTLSLSALTSGNFNYTVNSDGRTATITGYAGTPSGDLTIPSEIDGYKVTVIGDYAFSNCSGIEKAYFYGDVPSTWGNAVFGGNAPNFTICYIEGKKGWTSPTWRAPDGSVYNIATFTPYKVDFDKNVIEEGSIVNDKTAGFTLNVVDFKTKIPQPQYTGKSSQHLLTTAALWKRMLIGNLN